jgi:hypothetical protein
MKASSFLIGSCMFTTHHHCILAIYLMHILRMKLKLKGHYNFKEWLHHWNKAKLQCWVLLIWDNPPSLVQLNEPLIQIQSHLPDFSKHGILKSNLVFPSFFIFFQIFIGIRLRLNISNLMPNYFHFHLTYNIPYFHHMPINF